MSSKKFSIFFVLNILRTKKRAGIATSASAEKQNNPPRITYPHITKEPQTHPPDFRHNNAARPILPCAHRRNFMLGKNARVCKTRVIMASKNKTEPDFETTLAELEKLLEELESASPTLDESLEKYGRAKRCLDVCKARLAQAELKIRKIDNTGAEEDFDVNAEPRE